MSLTSSHAGGVGPTRNQGNGDTDDTTVEVRPSPLLDASLCRHFALRGTCRFQDDCHYSHILPDDCADWNEACQRIPCPHNARGICRYGTMCRLAHHNHGSTDNDHQEHVSVGSANHHGISRQGTDLVGKKATVAPIKSNLVSKQKDDTVGEEEIICGICLEPLGQETKNNQGKIKYSRKKFGLLSSCNHIFCIQCLRTWRKQKKESLNEERLMNDDGTTGNDSNTVRACPTCRQPSDFIIPSDRFCVGEEKEQVVSAYKARLSCTPCKRFNGKLGSCPFGKDCFYAHGDGKGNDMKEFDKTKQELWQERAEKQRLNSLRRRLQHDHHRVLLPHFTPTEWALMTQTERNSIHEFIYLASIGVFIDPLESSGSDDDENEDEDDDDGDIIFDPDLAIFAASFWTDSG